MKNCSAFTLIECLVAIGIVSVLATLAYASFENATENALRTRELSAARTLVQAYLSRAADHEGELMPGYQYGASVRLPNGEELTSEPAHRYPFRLAEYIDWEVNKIYLLNDTKKAVAGMDPNSSSYRYYVSLVPAFGMNMYCVGGNNTASGLLCKNDVVTRLGQVSRPANLLAFVSTRFKQGTETLDGYFFARPPVLGPSQWSSAAYSQNSDPAQYGYVDFRHGGKAVCAFLDGRVTLLALEELRDMRLWAEKADSPTYSLKLN